MRNDTHDYSRWAHNSFEAILSSWGHVDPSLWPRVMTSCLSTWKLKILYFESFYSPWSPILRCLKSWKSPSGSRTGFTIKLMVELISSNTLDTYYLDGNLFLFWPHFIYDPHLWSWSLLLGASWFHVSCVHVVLHVEISKSWKLYPHIGWHTSLWKGWPRSYQCFKT